MPSKTPAQHRLMEAAAHTPGGYGGVSQKVGKEFVSKDAEVVGSESERCAGILFSAPNIPYSKKPAYLLCRRSDNGIWEQPGGHLKTGEDWEEAAVRECEEEIGGCPDGSRWRIRFSGDEGIEFLTFGQKVEKPFIPALGREFDDYGWFEMDELESVNVHPEVLRTIELISGHELDISGHIQSGELISPQKYENIMLFDVRITGTGTAYRTKLDQYVYRPPAGFLSQEFLDRCVGLPVIFEHPEKTMLTTDEFRDRMIGTIILPYVKGDEAWGIAKIYDSDGAIAMQTTHRSTSPGVIFRDPDVNKKIILDGGQELVVEGSPSYLDHLAICVEGVWDKGGDEPPGINIGENNMEKTEETKEEKEKKEMDRKDAEEKARKDSDGINSFMDAIGKRFDDLNARFDALENKGGDQMPTEELEIDGNEESEEDRALNDLDKIAAAKKDAEEKIRKDSEEKARKDAEERMDSQLVRENRELKSRLDSFDARMRKITSGPTAVEREALAEAQSRADSVAVLFGDHVSPPMAGESPISYRKRLASKFQKHSPRFAKTNLEALSGEIFDSVEDTIYLDAQVVSESPVNLPEGTLREIKFTDFAGRQCKRYVGDIRTAFADFLPKKMAVKINRNAGKK